jgi:Xaa-Pro aminopeptidase
MLFNRSRAIEYMKDCGVDVLVATSPANVFYFSEYFCWTDPLFKEYMMSPGASSNLGQNFALFCAEGEPGLVIGPTFAMNAAGSWIKDIQLYGEFGLDYSMLSSPANDVEGRFLELMRNTPRHASAIEALLNVVRVRGLTTARIGVEMEALPAGTREAVRSALPQAEILDCSNLIRLVRAVKSDEEITRLARAAEINERCAMETLRSARPSNSAGKLIRHYRIRAAESEADFDHFAFGAGGLSIFTEPGYRFVPTDVMYSDFGCIYGHYFSDSGATFALGKLHSPLTEKYEVLRACMAAGAGKMRPGIRGSEIRAAMSEVLHQHGITTAFPHGHGLGIEIRDYPIIVPPNGLSIRDDCVDVSSDLPMEPGMINNLEVSVFMPTLGSVAIEQSFLVTTEGNRALVPQDRSSPVVASG